MIDLQKGARIDLTKEAPGMTRVHCGLYWNPRTTQGVAFDLDAMLFMLDANGNLANEKDLVYFKNLKSIDGSVEHMGDNLDGTGDGDDEVIKVDLTRVGAQYHKLVFVVNIHDAAARGQNFGQVSGAGIRLADASNPNDSKLKFDLTEDASVETCMIFAELYRVNGSWKFSAVGQGYKEGLVKLIESFGQGAKTS